MKEARHKGHKLHNYTYVKYPEQRQKESKWVPGVGEREKQEVTCLMGMVISLWVDENDLELVRGDGCSKL